MSRRRRRRHRSEATAVSGSGTVLAAALPAANPASPPAPIPLVAPARASSAPAQRPAVPSGRRSAVRSGGVEKLLLAGHWAGGKSVTPVRDPWSGQDAARVAQAGPREMDEAIEAAARSAPGLALETRLARSERLSEVSRLILRDAETLARHITREAGKPIQFSRIEVARAARTFASAAAEARGAMGRVWAPDSDPGGAAYTARSERFPLGPVAAITPFNFPLILVAHKVAPAVAVGNPVVVKPPPQAPSAALHLGRLLVEAGAPEGSISVLPCGPEVAESLATDPRIRMLSFTGSDAVGWKLRALAARKRCVLELGGNAAAVVHRDADLEWVAPRLALGAYLFAGQVCISVQRIFVERSVYRRFVRLFQHAAEDLVVGDPSDPATVCGPMIDEAALTRVEQWVAAARAAGAQPLLPGGRRGPALLPMALEHVPVGSDVECREVFGPVAVLAPYDRFEEALEAVNRSPYGLQASVFTHDERRIEEAFRALEVGAVIINDYPTLRFDHLPYGGVKSSGLGREGLANAMLEMTEERLLLSRQLTEAEAPRLEASPVRTPRAEDGWSGGRARASAHDVELEEDEERAIDESIEANERAARARPTAAPRAVKPARKGTPARAAAPEKPDAPEKSGSAGKPPLRKPVRRAGKRKTAARKRAPRK